MTLAERAAAAYLHDAVLHARVEIAVRELDAQTRAQFGRPLTDADRSLATLAAAMGVLAAEIAPEQIGAAPMPPAVSRLIRVTPPTYTDGTPPQGQNGASS